MARRIWKDRAVEKPRTFNLQNNPDGTVTLIPAPGVIVEPGTSVNASNLNGLEDDLETHKAEDATDAHKPKNVGVIIASKEEAEAGTSDVKYMTPLKTKQAIQVSPVNLSTGSYSIPSLSYSAGQSRTYNIPIGAGKAYAWGIFDSGFLFNVTSDISTAWTMSKGSVRLRTNPPLGVEGSYDDGVVFGKVVLYSAKIVGSYLELVLNNPGTGAYTNTAATIRWGAY